MDIEFEWTLLRALTDNVPHRIYAKDADGRFIYANQAVARGMGVGDPSELIGRTDFDFYPASEAAGYRRLEQALMESGQPIVDQEEHVRYLLLDRDTWLLTTKVPVRDAGGRVIGLAGLNHDITAQKSVELSLREAHKRTLAVEQELRATVERLNAQILERERLERQLRQLALHDALTGLPNRALLMDRLDHAVELARRKREALTLLFIDLDGFKRVNDRLGHASGDALLRVVGERLLGCIRASDTVARLGGDEFVVLLPNAMPADALAALAGRIRDRIAEPVPLGDGVVTVNCSIGCSVYPDDAEEAGALLSRADAAMYCAKSLGGNQARRFTP